MLDNVADGFLGLFLFFTQWLSPGAHDGEIRILNTITSAHHIVVECVITLEWNDQIVDLVDAGIPIKFHILSYTDRGDSVESIRTISCNVIDYTYTIQDSLFAGMDSVFISPQYTQIYKAIRVYQRFTRIVPKEASNIHIKAQLLPSHVNQLNRSIDISEICNCHTFTTHMVLKRSEQ